MFETQRNVSSDNSILAGGSAQAGQRILGTATRNTDGGALSSRRRGLPSKKSTTAEFE